MHFDGYAEDTSLTFFEKRDSYLYYFNVILLIYLLVLHCFIGMVVEVIL